MPSLDGVRFIAIFEETLSKSGLLGDDPRSDLKLTRMLESIMDCDVLLACCINKSTYEGLLLCSIQPILSNIPDALTAVKSCVAGELINHLEYLY